MAEKEIEIVGWWCVFEDGEPKAIFENEGDAYHWIKHWGDSWNEEGNCRVAQITRKVPFTEQIEPSKIGWDETEKLKELFERAEKDEVLDGVEVNRARV